MITKTKLKTGHEKRKLIKSSPIAIKSAKPVKIDYEQMKLFAKKAFSNTDISKMLKIDKRKFSLLLSKDKKLRDILQTERKLLIKNNPEIRHKGDKIIFSGAPPDYDKKYCKEMFEYFDVKPYKVKKLKEILKDGKEVHTEVIEPTDLPLLSGFAVRIGVHRETLKNWAESYPEFGYIYKLCKEVQDRNLVTNGLRGLYNTGYAQLVSKNFLGMKDMKDITSDRKPIETKTYMIPGFNEESDDEDDPESDDENKQ